LGQFPPNFGLNNRPTITIASAITPHHRRSLANAGGAEEAGGGYGDDVMQASQGKTRRANAVLC